MRHDTRYGFRFAAGAAVAVALGTLIAEALIDPAEQLFAGPPLALIMLVLSGGAFIWSYAVAAGTASVLKGIEDVPTIRAYAGGVAFALLTPLLGYVLYPASFLTAAVTMLIWLVAFPGLATFAFWWQFRRRNGKPATTNAA